MSIRSVLATLFCTVLILGQSLALHARDRRPAADEVIRFRNKLSDLPPMNMSRVHHNFTLDTSLEFPQDGSLEKRNHFNPNTWRDTDSRCLEPAEGAHPIVEDCLRLCDNIAGNGGRMIIGPLDIEHFQIGHCMFGVANLRVCDTIEILEIKQFAVMCRSMLFSCVRNGYDGLVEGSWPPMAFSLFGLPAAPPYSFREGCA